MDFDWSQLDRAGLPSPRRTRWDDARDALGMTLGASALYGFAWLLALVALTLAA